MKKNLFLIIIFGCLLFQVIQAGDLGFFGIFVEGDVRLLVEDNEGKKDGFDPVTKIFYSDMPGFGTGVYGDDVTYGWEFSSDESFNEPFSNSYKVMIIGMKKTEYKLDAGFAQESGGADFHFEGTLDSMATITYLFYYSTDSTEKIIFEEFDTNNLNVHLLNSQNQPLTNGTLKYYEGGWKEAVNNGDGIFQVETDLETVKLRMIYAHASQDMADVPVNGGPVTFQTVPVKVELRDSQNQLIDEGSVKYYSGGWRTFGTTSGGIAVKELLPKSYKFRLTYAHASNDLTQDVDDNETVVFQTVPVQVELRDSQNQLMDEGTVKYYSGGWRTFGNTSGGVVEKELLPNAYKFRMTFAYASNDMTQNIEDNPLVSFQTIQATVELRDSQNQLMDEGTVKYYSGGWRDFDATSGGIAEKELLPNSYKFRMTYAYASEDRTQDLSENETVTFSTVRTTVTVKDAQGNHIDGAVVKYYSGGWRNYGTTSGGIAEKELLAKSYKFRATYSGSSRDVIQDVSVNPDVEIVLD